MKTSGKILHWTPRILCILSILFVSMFALDSFNPKLTVWQQIGGFLIHLIPTYILTVALLVAWKWEKIGGVIFIILGTVFSAFLINLNYNRTHSIGTTLEIVAMLSFPFVIFGVLFLISDSMKKQIK